MSGFRLPCINKEMSLRLKVIIKDCCLFLEGDRRFIYIRTVAWVVQEIERKEGKKIEGVMIARCTLYLTFQHIITVPDLIRPISSNTMLTRHGLVCTEVGKIRGGHPNQLRTTVETLIMHNVGRRSILCIITYLHYQIKVCISRKDGPSSTCN